MNQPAKKALKFILSMSSIFVLAACGGGGDGSSSSSIPTGFTPGDVISVANADGKYYVADVGNPGDPMPVYAAKGQGDVPYVNLKFYEQFLSSEFNTPIQVSVEGKAGTISAKNVQNAKAIFDAENNEIRLKNYSAIAGSEKMNNGLGYDYCLPKTLQTINTSKKTKIASAGSETVTIKLNDYGLKVYEQGGSIYVPLELATLVAYSNSHSSFVFNGKDYFKSPVDYKTPSLSMYCYSGNGGFYHGYMQGGYFNGAGYKKVDPQGSNEKYRFATTDNEDRTTDYGAMVLYKDGTGKVFEKVDNQMAERVIDGQIWRIFFEEEKDTMTLYVLEAIQGSGDDVKASKTNYSKIYRINTGKTRYSQTERSQQMADYTYGLLCLSFDHFYGNKEFVTKGTFDSYLDQQGLKSRLKSKTVATYSEAMGEFLNKNIGDGHTAISGLSAYEPPNRAKMNSYISKYQSQRVKNILQRRQDLMPKRYEKLGHATGYTFADVSGDTALVCFDQFVSDGLPSYFRNYVNAEPEQMVLADSCGFFANSIMFLENYNKDEKNVKVKNVVLDLSCNEGGVMACMPYLAGIMTKDPTFYVKEVTSGKVTEYHYECDFDGDGKYGDTYADKYDFFVLVSSASFSCATAFPGMLKGTNVKIIGEKSAGGASPVTHFADGSGMAYQTSGNDIVCYKDGNEFKSVEEGTPVDYEIPEAIWYDLPQLSAKLNELKNK